MIPRGEPGVVERSRFAGSRWLAGGAVVVLLGVGGSVLAARAVARSDEHAAQRAQVADAANVGSRLQFVLQHEEDLVVDIEAEPGIAAQGDEARLGQMVDNLLSNAIKYTPDGGDVSITMHQDGDTATIAIRDSGIGIPQEEQAQLFSRFFRSSNARASGVQGTGLGLAITRGIVEAHGGTIGFDSVEGAGTTFRVTLPHVHRVEVALG